MLALWSTADGGLLAHRVLPKKALALLFGRLKEEQVRGVWAGVYMYMDVCDGLNYSCSCFAVLRGPIHLYLYLPQQQSPPQVLIVHDKVGDVRAYPATKEELDKYVR